MLGGYLAGSWLCGAMPASYYGHEGGVQWGLVLAQLLVQDTLQVRMRRRACAAAL